MINTRSTLVCIAFTVGVAALSGACAPSSSSPNAAGSTGLPPAAGGSANAGQTGASGGLTSGGAGSTTVNGGSTATAAGSGGASTGSSPPGGGAMQSGGSAHTGGAVQTGGSAHTGGAVQTGGFAHTGGSGSAGMTSSGNATFAAVAGIIESRCGAPQCHGGSPEGRSLNLVDRSKLYDRLLNTTVSACQNHPLVMPNDPSRSALIDLPTWQCDDIVMPQGCFDDPCLDAQELNTFRNWISAGAPK